MSASKELSKKTLSAPSSQTAKWWSPVSSTSGRSLKYLVTAIVFVVFGFAVDSPYWLHVAALVGVYWVLVSGLSLIEGYGGQLSVGHVGLLAVGAYTAAALVSKLGVSSYLGLVIGGIAGGVAGAIIGFPTLRLQGFYFAITTLGFVIIVDALALELDGITGGGIGLPGPTFDVFGASFRGLYFFVLLIAFIASFVTGTLASGSRGRQLVAIRESEVLARSCGIPVTRVKLTTFVLSGVLAGVAGGLYASVQTYITPDAFGLTLSIAFFVMVLIGGSGQMVGPFVATVVLGALPAVTQGFAEWSTFVYGGILLLVVVVAPQGVGPAVARGVRLARSHRLAGFGGRWTGAPGGASEPISGDVAGPSVNNQLVKAKTLREGESVGTRFAARQTGTSHSEELLQVEGLVKRFGGVTAVNDVTLALHEGEILGILGPNGSGKTTLLNLVSGLYKADQGAVVLEGIDVTRWAPERRFRAGMARTFQTPKLVDDLPVLDNVLLARRTTGRRRERQRRRPRGFGVESRTGAEDAARWAGLGTKLGLPASELQHGERRMLEIGRAMLSGPRVLLLDEPAAGLDRAALGELASRIEELAARGLGIVLVEHRLDLVFRVATRIAVMSNGALIADGTPAQIRSNDQVRAAYFGTASNGHGVG